MTNRGSRLILARHGNTFLPGQTAVWVGAKLDLPLVPSGEAQAEALAEGIRAAGLIPPALISGGLKRTRRTAAIIAERLGLPAPSADSRLDEIDYGSWEGRPNAAIDAEGGAEAQVAWNERDVWPPGAGWQPDEAALKARLASFVADWTASAAPAMVVTSSGILRFLARLLLPESAWDRPSFKMRTGRVGIIEDGRLVKWDSGPGELS